MGCASEGSALEACGGATGFSPWGLHFLFINLFKTLIPDYFNQFPDPYKVLSASLFSRPLFLNWILLF